MQNTRILTVSESFRSQPKITLTGAWLRKYGFIPGDSISVTCTEPGLLAVRLHLPAPEYPMQELQLEAAEPPSQYQKVSQPVILDGQPMEQSKQDRHQTD
jgi:hypothetical protein